MLITTNTNQISNIGAYHQKQNNEKKTYWRQIETSTMCRGSRSTKTKKGTEELLLPQPLRLPQS